MKHLLMICSLVLLASCGGSQEEAAPGEIKPSTLETISKEEAYQQELEEINAELDSLLEVL